MNIQELTSIHDIREGDVVVANYTNYGLVGLIKEITHKDSGATAIVANPVTEITYDDEGKPRMKTRDDEKNFPVYFINGDSEIPQSV